MYAVPPPNNNSRGSKNNTWVSAHPEIRLQQLTAAGINLEGVRRILQLEAEIERLTAEIERITAEATEAVEQTHRQYRRDLVPVRQSRLPARWRP